MKKVKEVLDVLVRLQEIDSGLGEYRAQRDELKEKLGQLVELVARMGRSIEQKQEKLEELEAWYKEQAETIRKDNERIAKLKGSLGSVTKTKEYLLRQREIETLRKAKQSKDDELKKADEAIAEFRERIQEEIDKQEGIKAETESESGEGWKKVEQLDGRIQEISLDREKIAADLPASILSKYDTISKRRGGMAVVKAMNHSCGGCHVYIRPQKYNTLLRNESIENCTSCTRFIYIPTGEMEEQLNGK